MTLLASKIYDVTASYHIACFGSPELIRARHFNTSQSLRSSIRSVKRGNRENSYDVLTKILRGCNDVLQVIVYAYVKILDIVTLQRCTKTLDDCKITR